MRKQNKRFAAVMALTLALTMVFSSVSVNAATKKVKSMTLSVKTVTLTVDQTKKVTVKKVTPAKASKKVTWKSSDKNVATVSKTGVITAKAEGKATITATSTSNKKVKRTVKVTVNPIPTPSEYYYASPAEAKEAWLKLKETPKTVILDVRDADVRANGYLRDTVAASIHAADASKQYDKIAAAKYEKIYIMCNSGNKLAKDATDMLVAKGVDEKIILTIGGEDGKRSDEGGWKAWVKNYPENVYVTADTTNAKLADANVVVVDCRQVADYKAGHIKGAVSASQASVVLADKADKAEGIAADNIKKLVQEKGTDKEYILACYSGNRYAQAATKNLVAAGVPNANIKTIEGGMGAWAQNLFATPEYVKSVLGKDGIVVVDCRKVADYEKGHIDGAVSASMDSEISLDKADKADGVAAENAKKVVAQYGKDKTYIFACYSGARYAAAATKCFAAEGVPMKNLKTIEGGMKAWA